MTTEKTEITQYPDGIYFNMPFRVYAAQDRHSTSRLNKINKGALIYWTDEIEPTLADDFDLDAKLDETTEAMAEGKAWHTMALEGLDVFNQRYATGYNPANNPLAIKSKDEHLKACVKHGVPHKKGDTIAALQDALIAAGANVQFHSVLKRRHEEDAGGKGLITPEAMDELLRAGKILKEYGIYDDMLCDGFPEVTILFTMDGRKFKVRVDYLRTDRQIEFKTIMRRSRTKPFEEACADTLHDFGYFTSAYLYQCAVVTVKRKGGLPVFNLSDDIAAPTPEWMTRLYASNNHEYWHLFQERGKYNHVLPRRFDKYDEALQTRKIQAIWRTGQSNVEQAVKVYDWYMENNGKDKRWLPDLNPKPWDDSDFKPWQIEE